MQRLTIVLTSLVLTSASLMAQATPSGRGSTRTDNAGRSGQLAQRSDTTERDTTTRNTTAGDTLRIDSFVRYSDGRAAEFARVVLSETGARAAQRARYTRTDSTGRFVIDSVAVGEYDLQVIQGGSLTPHEMRLKVDGRPTPDVLISSYAPPAWWLTLAVLVLYLFTVFATRWHHIARSLGAILERELSGLKTRLETEVEPTRPEKEALKKAIDKVWDDVKQRQDARWYKLWSGNGLWDVLWWSRGVENAAWAAIHEAERQMVSFIAPVERVDVHLREVEARLREVGSKPALAIADGITVSLTTARPEQERRALLARSLQILNTDRDTTFAALMEWQNKASWLMLAATIIIMFLAAAVGNAVLFLAGAAGGFLSRLARALKSDDIPLDYGASWSTLFLSPLFGALIGWFGIALITLLMRPEVNLLGDAFDVVSWAEPNSPFTLSVAFLLGFSERFFDAIVGVVEKQVGRSGMAARTDDPPRVAPAPARVDTPTPVAEPPASAGGITIDLPDTPFTPVQTVSGKVVFDKAATTPTVVTLKTSNLEFSVNPSALTIAVGATEGTFDVVPKGNPTPGTIRITAQSESTTISDTIKYT